MEGGAWMNDGHEVTRLLDQVASGDPKASAELLPLVYEELRRLARARMAQEPAGLTLQPTALVHEAYMRLVGSSDTNWNGRGHFFGAAALAMRRILVERARSVHRLKRGGDRRRVELDDRVGDREPDPAEVIGIDEVLARLEVFDRRKAEVVMMRYFAGLTIEEIAAALGLSVAQVKGEWSFARAWLHRELSRREDEPTTSTGDSPDSTAT